MSKVAVQKPVIIALPQVIPHPPLIAAVHQIKDSDVATLKASIVLLQAELSSRKNTGYFFCPCASDCTDCLSGNTTSANVSLVPAGL